MTKQSKIYVVIVFCVAYLLQPFAVLASSIDRTFHEEVIGITVDYGFGEEQVLEFQLDTDVQGFNHEFSDGTSYYGSNIEDESSASMAVLLDVPTLPNVFASSYKYHFSKTLFKSVSLHMETPPPIYS